MILPEIRSEYQTGIRDDKIRKKWYTSLLYSLVDAFSKFAAQESGMITDWIYMAATIVIASVYCLYLKRLPDNEERAA